MTKHLMLLLKKGLGDSRVVNHSTIYRTIIMKKISIAVIAKNEADRIGRLLKSVEFADEVIVVDSGSTDGTQDLCKQFGAKVIFNKWPGYAAQKQFAMEHAVSEWILSLVIAMNSAWYIFLKHAKVWESGLHV